LDQKVYAQNLALAKLSTLNSLDREVLLKGRVSTVHLLVLTSLDQLIFILKILLAYFTKTSYLNEEVNCIEPSPLVSIPWFIMSHPIHHPTGHQRQRAEVFEELQPGAAGAQPAEEGGRSVGYRRRRQVSTLKNVISFVTGVATKHPRVSVP
jgi:hypothetical protein